MDHASVILSAIIPDRRDLLLFAVQHLEEGHFRNYENKNLFNLLTRYYDIAGDVIPLQALVDLVRRSDADEAKAILYEETYRKFSRTTVSDHEFKYAIEALQDLRAHQITGEMITKSFEILEQGVEVNHKNYRGHKDARTFLYGALPKADKLGGVDVAPEGDVRFEGEEMRQDYLARKNGLIRSGIETAIPYIDDITGGFQPGELVLMVGYTGIGKSSLVLQTAWNAAIRQGKNVFFATSETLRAQVRRRLQARHSRLTQFAVPDGLNSADIKNGTLSAAEEDKLMEVIQDLTTNPTYGKLYVAQVPGGANLGYIEARASRSQMQWNIDLLIIDYLALLKSNTSRQSKREEMDEIIKDAKVMAASFNDGKGVPLISPWAVTQTAYRDAKAGGGYTLANLAESSESEKSADVIVSMLEVTGSRNELLVQFLKNRDGEVPAAGYLESDFRNSYFVERSRQDVTQGLIDGF